VLVIMAACAPLHEGETLERLNRIDQRLAHIEEQLASQDRGGEPTAPVAAATPATSSAAPGAAAAPAVTPAASTPPPPASEAAAGPSRATLLATVRLDGSFAGAGGASVVSLRPLEGRVRAHRPGHYMMEQLKKQFVPHVLAVPVGSAVGFPNHDVFFHNVFSLSSTKPFDLGVFNTNQSRDVTFDKPGVVQILCNLHALMSAYIVIIDDPYFAVGDDSGRVSIRDLPAGRYRLRVWSERSRRVLERDVELAGGPNRLVLGVTADAPPQTPPDKHGRPRAAGY
jgi:plastocyanin